MKQLDKSATESKCQDENQQCKKWATKGECDANPAYMIHYCKRSCQQCPDQRPKDEEIARGIDFGELQLLPIHDTERTLVLQQIQETKLYIEQLKKEQTISSGLLELCRNKHEKCTSWALEGECQDTPKYMELNCAPACKSCEQLDMAKRCPLSDRINPHAALEPGDLNRMFERLVAEPYRSQYQVKVLSKDPWVITMENVITAEQANRMIEIGHAQDYKRSRAVGKLQVDGTIARTMIEGRTSTTTWCKKACLEDPLAQQVVKRISDITQIHSNNSESLQLLRYEEGQYYRKHHDYSPGGKERQAGVRILTVYLYLNDVAAGGGTLFNDLNITVMPKLGRAVLWPSVVNDEPHEKDHRTFHEALPVEAGVKYGVNAWFHQYDYQTPNAKGCT